MWRPLYIGVLIGVIAVNAPQTVLQIFGGPSLWERWDVTLPLWLSAACLGAGAELLWGQTGRARRIELDEKDVKVAERKVVVWEKQAALVSIEDPPEPEPEPDAARYAGRWRVAAYHFCWAGEQYGFTLRKMVDEQQIMGARAWHAMTDVLAAAGVLRKVEREATGWGAGWDWERFAAAYHALALPHAAVDPPQFKVPVNSAQGSRRKQARAVVIDGNREG